MFTIKAVVETYKEDIRKNFQAYSGSRWNKLCGFIMPWGVVKVLRKYGFMSQIGFCRYKIYAKKIEFIKNKIKEGYPLILVIGHAYGKDTSKFSLWKALFLQHYLSVWGYDDKKRVFYVYDSGRHVEKQRVPVGNLSIAYDDLIKCRGFGGWGLLGNIYIKNRLRNI
ncbi:C39 family peptidase [Candidatus Gracilibacteria bacterium]|nr:C39 family peptidase [Candidatus Gracilibacteria bacterium]